MGYGKTDMTVFLEWLFTHIGFIFGFLAALVLIAHVLTQRRAPSGTIAWLLAIVLVPYVGIPLYLMLGGRKMKRQAGRKTGPAFFPSSQRLNVPRTYLDELLESYGLPPASDGNQLELCTDGQATYRDLTDIIENARQSIYISTFIFRGDSVGRDILSRLTSKARQGLDVRILLDGVGSLWTSRFFFRRFVRAGGKYGVFLPLLHWPFRGRTNLRNHRKIVIADNQVVLAGGTNIGLEYLGPKPSSKRWQDLSFVLRGPAVASYLEIFRSDWAFAIGQQDWPEGRDACSAAAAENADAVVQIIPSGPDVPGDALYDAILTSFFNAQKRIWIVTPYFVPDEPLLKAIQLAVRKGLDVRVVVPQKSNHPMTDVVRRVYLRDIQQVGAKVFFYQKGMIHAKTILIDDDIMMAGSANTDFRSLFLNYEVMLVAYRGQVIGKTQQWMTDIQSQCSQKTITVNPVQNIVDHIVNLFSPLL